MLNDTKKLVIIGGKAAILAALLGSTAMAQDTEIESSTGETVLVPEAAETAESPEGAINPTDFPLPEQLDNEEAVAETLIAQGFEDIHILREGPMLTVNATRDGVPTELVYSVANGSLVSVDGEELRDDEEGSSANDTAATDMDDAEDADDANDPDDVNDQNDADTSDDGSADTDTDTDTDADTGDSDSDTGSDTDGNSDSDSGAGSDGSDGGSDSDGGDSDGGSDGGESDGGSDGGDSDGGDGGTN